MTDFYKQVMDDIWANSNYDVSWACIGGEHNKCKQICSCKCHKEQR